MEKLANIFGSEEKVKLLRLFLFNQSSVFDETSILKKTGISKKIALNEIERLLKSGCIKKKQISIELLKKKGKKIVKAIRKVNAWQYDTSFIFGDSLRQLFSLATISTHNILSKRVASVGKIKLLVLAGIFIQDNESRVDMLIVGDLINKRKLSTLMASLEAEIGREINYSVFETQDFMYRLGLYDKLIRDILDYPHKKIINKLGIER